MSASLLALRFITLFFFLSLVACSSGQANSATPTLTPLEARGQTVFKATCTNCHATTGESVIVGPSLAGIATRGAERIEGMDAKTYITNSILDPGAYIVEGFPTNLMPVDLGTQLSKEDIEAVVAYLLTLDS